MADEAMNTLTPQERESGWELLFDGESTDKWRGFQKDEFPDGWQVVDGTLHRADKAGDIVTKEEYADFELSIEWKVAGPGNSGIMYRASEAEDAPWKTGPEYQILNDDIHPDGKNPVTSAGSLYALYPPEGAETKPVGQWNHTRILVKGNLVEHWLNGKKVVEAEINGPEWNKRVAESKFRQFPNFGKMPKGHIVLQDHNDPVWYRNIKIKTL
ncbi:MAG: DUF1080 domain-containing protein [Phycisphaerae bacterium]